MHKPANLYNNIGPHEHPPLILILRPKPKKHVIMPLASDAALQAPPCTQTTHHSIMLMAALPRPVHHLRQVAHRQAASENAPLQDNIVH